MPSPLPLKLVKVNTILPDGTSGDCGYLNNTSSMATFTAMADLIEDTRYTLSLELKAAALSTLSVTSGAHGETLTRVVGTDWTRIAITFTSDGRDLSFILPRGEYYFYHAKLEKGSVATDWSPSPLDAGFGASFGGRNYILNSNVNTSTASSTICSLDTSTLLETDTTYTLTVNGGFDDYVEYPDDYYIHCSLHSNDDEFAVEFDIKGASEIGEGTVEPHYESFKTPYSFPSSTTSFTLDCTYVYPDGSDDIPEATVKWVKLERGNKPTDWTPAPEDIQNGISDLDQNLRTTIEEAKTQVITTADEHATEMMKTKLDISAHEQYVNEVDSRFAQTVDEIQMQFGTVNQAITEIGSQATQQMNSLIKHITFTDDGVEIRPEWEGDCNNLLNDTKSPTITTSDPNGEGDEKYMNPKHWIVYNAWANTYHTAHVSPNLSYSVDNVMDSPVNNVRRCMTCKNSIDYGSYFEIDVNQDVIAQSVSFSVWVKGTGRVRVVGGGGSFIDTLTSVTYSEWTKLTGTCVNLTFDSNYGRHFIMGSIGNEGDSMSFLAPVLTIGSTPSDIWQPSETEKSGVVLIVDSSKISFEKNGQTVSFWDGDDFFTGNVHVRVDEQAVFGNYGFYPKKDGSLIFKRR